MYVVRTGCNSYTVLIVIQHILYINVKDCSLYTVNGDGSKTAKIIKKGNVNHTNLA